MPENLAEHFDHLARQLRQVISLLEESQDPFWITSLTRGLRHIDEHRLAGATFVLGCFGGQDTFSDVVIGQQWQDTQPLQFRNLNARLKRHRDEIFTSANAIASRRHW